MDMKPIHQANIEDDVRHMEAAKQRNDLVAFDTAKASLRTTLEAIRSADEATYNKYAHLLEAEMTDNGEP